MRRMLAASMAASRRDWREFALGIRGRVVVNVLPTHFFFEIIPIQQGCTRSGLDTRLSILKVFEIRGREQAKYSSGGIRC